jgi:magnesium transporter
MANPDQRISVDMLPEDAGELQTFFRDTHPADLADLMHRVDPAAGLALFTSMEAEKQAEILPELNESLREKILESLPHEDLAPMLEEMESDDAVDVVQDLQELDEERAEGLLAGLDSELREEIEQLLEYPDDTAGGVMASEVVAVAPEMSLDEAIHEVRRVVEEREIEDIYALYVVDDHGHLKGMVSMQDLLLARRGQKVRDILDEDVISVEAMTDQEELASIARKYDLASIPVVDDAGRLLGRVTMDDVYDIAMEEAEEDIAHMAGTDEEVLERSSLVIVRERLPWLLVGLAGGLFSAAVMSLFEGDLKIALQASFFVPVIMGMGGNVGIQSSTIVVRGLATGELDLTDTWSRLFRETRVSLMVGLVCSLILLGVIWIWMGDPKTASVIAVSLSAVIFQASVVGAMVPLMLKKWGIDPALATGPFITTTNDILGLSVYLLLISYFLV